MDPFLRFSWYFLSFSFHKYITTHNFVFRSDSLIEKTMNLSVLSFQFFQQRGELLHMFELIKNRASHRRLGEEGKDSLPYLHERGVQAKTLEAGMDEILKRAN